MSAALGVVVLVGGLGIGEHPMRRVLGLVLIGYAGIRVLVNIWLSRVERSRKRDKM